MPFAHRALLAIKRIAVVIGIAVAFSVGLFSAIYLSLRSSETKVPDIVGKDRAAAENTISDAGLNFRVRATRASSEAKPDTVLIQLPRAGEIVKVGQTVAVDISRPTREGEASTTEATASNSNSSGEKKLEAGNNLNSQSNANSQSNGNDNKPKRKQANQNANDNTNANLNQNRIANRNRNLNSAPSESENANRASTPLQETNRSAENSNRSENSNRGENSNRSGGNVNRRPIITPTP